MDYCSKSQLDAAICLFLQYLKKGTVDDMEWQQIQLFGGAEK